MGRSPCCAKVGLKRGAWDATEDGILTDFIKTHGEGKWKSLPQRAGLKRCGKSCRLRWLNYLKPGIKRGNISPEEDDLIFRLHKILGNRWSLIAGRLPGRTDNEIKNYWNSNLAKRIGAQSFSEPSKRSSAKKDHAENPASEATGVPATIPIRTKARKLSKKLPDMMPLNDYIIKSSQPQNAVQPDIVQPHEENDCNQGEDIQPDIVQPHEENDCNQGEDIQPYIVQSHEENDCNQGEDINVVHSDLDLHTMKFASDELQAHNDGAKGDFIFTNDLCLSQEYSLDVHGETTLDWLFKQMSEDDKMNIDLGSSDSFLGYDEWLNY